MPLKEGALTVSKLVAKKGKGGVFFSEERKGELPRAINRSAT